MNKRLLALPAAFFAVGLATLVGGGAAQYRFASPPQSCTRLASGDTIFTSRGNNGRGPQLIEVTPDKKVVRVLQDWEDLGPATAVQILDDPGVPGIPGQSEH